MDRRTFIQFSAAVIGQLSVARGDRANLAPEHKEFAASALEPISFSTTQVITAADTDSTAVEKAAMVLPRPNQSMWMRYERTFFIHFGPNTFRNVEWGDGHESPSDYNPLSFDADQWVKAIQEAGGKLAIPVCKHHDGLCLWQTRYTKHSVASSPWMGGKGDEIRAVADAAKRRGVKLGIYLSPADLYQLTTNTSNPDGYYGNGSDTVLSVIPTDPDCFKSNPTKQRTVAHGLKSFSYSVNDYNRYFLNQLYELLTEYGPIHEVWFDGANPDPSVHETYNYEAWYDMIRQLAPEAVIAVKGPDCRWVGNEGGVGRTTEWSVLPLSTSPETFNWPDMHDFDLGGRDKLVPGSHLWWYPTETNCPILHGWFWAPEKPCRTATELIELYYSSVGRNGNMLLNLSPDTRGLIPDDQLANLHVMTQAVDQTFARNLALGASVTADNSNFDHWPQLVLDDNLDAWWEAADGRTSGILTFSLPEQTSFDVLSLQEAVDHRSQRIEAFCVDVWDGSSWTQIDQQTTVGHKRLLRWESPVTTNRLRIRITSSRLEPTLATLGLYKQAVLVPAPVISDRDSNGYVTITTQKGLSIVYCADSAVLTNQSKQYSTPIDISMGGVVRAACVGADGAIGMYASKVFYGYAPRGWMVVAAAGPNGGSASNAIDGSTSTFWDSGETTIAPSLTVDTGGNLQMAGFAYLPRQDSNLDGTVDNYRFEISTDGQNWMVVSEGRFTNIKNNPIEQIVSFAIVTARYFRFTALTDVNGKARAGIAEITVLPAWHMDSH